MVATVSAIKDSGAASDYYSQTDDYYRDQGHAPTAWAGRGAEALGLAGEVSTAQAEAVLDGYLPNGERVGGDDHRPGWDVTFSAPKSVSVAAYVHGDDRLIGAHDDAVRAAIDYLERNVAATRIRENNEIRTEATGNLVCATYRHDTNREAEPQLHTHTLVMNVTQDRDGNWRSLESRPLYRLQTEAGAVYRAALARSVERLGYSIEKTQEGKHLGFEIRQISEAERKLFSSRSEQIERELQKMGLTRENATAEQKQIAALNTRQGKEELDRSNLMSGWRAQAQAAGFAPGERPEAVSMPDSVYEQRADDAVRRAVEHLSERETRFTDSQIISEARKIGMASVDDQDIRAAVERASARGELVPTTTRQFDAIVGQKQEQSGYTTAEAQTIERNMLAHAERAADAAAPALTQEQVDAAILAQEQRTGHRFNDAQIQATRAVLAGNDRVTLVQGYAGTAKTTSVLAASADAYRERGFEIIALAPTHSAAQTLGDSIGAESQTVAKYLNSAQDHSGKNRVYVVDEASMLSARDMEKLLARTQDARVVMVGDVKQLGSVEAGAAFRQLQETGLKTQVLDQIVRQKNDELRAAVYDAIRGDAGAALSKVEVRELDTRAERVEAIAREYTSAGPAGREKTIIIAPGRDDRRELNEAVRAELKSRGELGESRKIQTLERKDRTAQEAGRASSYAVGDRVIAQRDYQSLGCKKGESMAVVAVDVDKNKITLQNKSGERYQIDPERYSKLQAYSSRDLEVAPGDRLIVRENTEKLKNGTALHVEKIDDQHIHARDADGKLHKLELAKENKLDHGYAQTGHESQGRTCEKVLVHGESHRVNLQNQQNAYVALSRATETAIVYTDNRDKLVEQIDRESGQKETALEQKNREQQHQPEPVSEKPAPTPEPEPAPWDAQENDREAQIIEREQENSYEYER